MSDSGLRPHPQKIIAAYDRLFRSDTPLSKLKDAAFSGRLLPQTQNQDALGIPGRSLAWKLFLIPTVPLTPPASQLLAEPPLTKLRERRKEYASLLLEKMRAPDGSYEDGFSVPDVGDLPRPSDRDANMNLQRNNPLSLHEDNPWKDWFAAVDLRKTIRQDVERTFPDHEYFRDPEVQAQLTNILYIYSVTHPDIGYRQGMHELLAPLFHAVDYDSIPSTPQDQDFPSDPSSSTAASGEDEELAEFCSRTWVPADAWALFSIVMSGVGVWYEWREPSPPPTFPVSTPFPQYRHGPPETSDFSLKPYIAPIVLACQKLQSQMLKSADPVLWQAMQKAGIEPQIYGIRWLRLLFTREFPLHDAMILWDGIFSCDDTFKLVPWICVAMLIRIRNQLIPSDYSAQLTYLLRYPAPPSPSTSENYPSTPHHAVLLLRQAFALYTSPNPSTGSSIAIENRNLLDIPLEVPEAYDRKKAAAGPGLRERRVRSSTDVRRAAAAGGAGGITSSSAFVTGSGRPVQQPHLPSQTTTAQLGFPELLARGILEKSESLGINKTVMNAVSELRKNIPELASQFIGTPSPSHESASTGTASPVPLVSERPPAPHETKAKAQAQAQAQDRPPWEHRTRVEMEREIAHLRWLQKKLGDAVGVAVDALLQDESVEEEGEEALKRIRNRKREAIESLAHARDLLLGATGELDEERLFGEEEYRRRKSLASRPDAGASSVPGRGSGATTSPSLLPPRPPEPVAAAPVPAPIPTRPSSEHHRRQKSSPPITSLPRTVSVPQSPPPPMPEHVSLKRVGQLTTLPRQRSGGGIGSGSSQSNSNANAFHAPWNYTKSNFSTPTLDSTSGVSLPRPPPRSSQSPVSMRGSTDRDQESGYTAPEMPVPGRQVRKASHDPLGALSS